jgi:hypothetical protein
MTVSASYFRTHMFELQKGFLSAPSATIWVEDAKSGKVLFQVKSPKKSNTSSAEKLIKYLEKTRSSRIHDEKIVATVRKNIDKELAARAKMHEDGTY